MATAKKTYNDAFAKFTNSNNQTVFIPALDGEVVFRALTMEESDGFNERLIDGYDDNGKAQFNYSEANLIKYEKAALCLIEPKVTIEELKAYPSDFIHVISEINVAIDGGKLGDDAETDEGND